MNIEDIWALCGATESFLSQIGSGKETIIHPLAQIAYLKGRIRYLDGQQLCPAQHNHIRQHISSI
ncbi:MAG: hypothetical protein AAF639_15590 [Chloroflexota bacterium]